ncbi:MAG: hypothetical protein ACC628_22775 [Pirellulaceae bacterium]
MLDIHQAPTNEYGEWDDGAVEDYCNGLMEEFAASPEGDAAAEHYGDIGWTHFFLYYGFNYLGSAPPEMSRADVEEILFDLFPRKVSTEPDSAAEIIGELRAFFEFLHRQYGLTNAKEILQDLGNEATGQLERELADPDNFGMAKSFVMMGNEAGFGMTTQEGMNEFMLAHNAALAQRHVNEDSRESAEPRSSLSARSSPKPSTVRLSANERKSREKLRRKKLGKSKRRR